VRLFAAVRPSVEALEHLAGALAGLRDDRLRWTPPETWHLTLAFYGEVPDGAAEELAEGLEALAAGTVPFEAGLRGAGVFSGRTLWVGTGTGTDGFAALCRGAREVGGQVLGRVEDRERARPHLTVARQRVEHGRRSPGAAERLARALGVYEGPPWTVSEVLLVRSELGKGRGGGPLHTDLGAFPTGVAPWSP